MRLCQVPCETVTYRVKDNPAGWHAGQPGEQWTMFFTDDSGNALEFKAMTNPENLFAKYVVE